MGLRRHHVENLVLRGPVFYWRARIRVGLRASGRDARLSLSLRLSDRKKASLVARRLNAMLLELEMVPKARMATKEQLARIFALEAEAMRSEIEALDLEMAAFGGSKLNLRQPNWGAHLPSINWHRRGSENDFLTDNAM